MGDKIYPSLILFLKSHIFMPKQNFGEKIPELDGVRGLAILLVLCFHILKRADYFTQNQLLHLISSTVQIGWVGVDLFFVLSGFLITGILLQTREDLNYFKNFYARRILRIFPLYFLIIGGIFLLLPVLTPNRASIDQASWPYFALYLQNWLVIPSLNLGSYSKFVGPSWSLAIEEQFYIVWPSLVFLLSRHKLVFLSIAIVIFSLVARLILVQFADHWKFLSYFLYFGSFTRFDGFSVGALIAIAFQSEQWKRAFSRFAWPVLIVALIGIIAIVINSGNVSPLEKDYYLNTWGYTLVALASGALLLVVTTSPKHAILASFFRNRVLGFFGKYSYAMYLIHLPVMLIVFQNTEHFQRNSIIAWLIFVGTVFGLTILGSLLTWHLLEKQMLKLKKYFEYQTTEV